MTTEQDLYFMGLALEEARRAASLGEVPIGAVVVKNDQIIGRGCNRVINSADPTAHAEIEALRDACQDQDNYRLTDTTIYTTLEPCLMCFASLVHARVSRIVYGAHDPKGGYQLNLKNQAALNHHPAITSGILAIECSGLLKDFFQVRR
jgi:tRNA(adenine34) deaminase